MNRYQIVQCMSIGVFSIFFLMLSGCKSVGGECSELYDCTSGSICVDGTCKVICNGDGDCSDGDRCRLGVCVPPSELSGCGNGLVDPGEECDDANVDNTDSCLNSCVSAVCGDGFIQRDAEECDLGSGLNQDDGACTSTCQQAVCGDGFVQAGVETCDEGENNSDAWSVASHCNSTCDGVAPFCGDATVSDGETCDGDCVSSCDDTNTCTADVMTGSAESCNVVCENNPITACTNDDGCCAPGCNSETDSDCPESRAFLGHVRRFEQVNSCFNDASVGCVSNDGCCGAGCTVANDNDCVGVFQSGITVRLTGTDDTGESYDIQAPDVSGADGQYEVYGYVVNNGDLQMKLSPSGAATAGDAFAPAAGYANPQLAPTGSGPFEDTPFDPFYASFSWLATVAAECGVVADPADAAIDSLFLTKSSLVGQLVDGNGNGASGVPAYGISVSMMRQGNKLNNRAGETCFLEIGNDGVLHGTTAATSRPGGYFALFGLRGANDTGNADAIVQVADYLRGIVFDTVTVSLSARQAGIVKVTTSEVVPAGGDPVDFETEILPIFEVGTSVGFGCFSCHRDTDNAAAEPFSNLRCNADTGECFRPLWSRNDCTEHSGLALGGACSEEDQVTFVYNNIVGPGTICGSGCEDRYLSTYEEDPTFPRVCVDEPDCSLLLQRPSQSEAFHGAQFDTWDTVAGTVRNWIEQGAPRYSRIYFEADVSQAQGGVLSTLGCVNGCHQALGNNDSGSSAFRAGQPAIFVGNDTDVWLNLTGRSNLNADIPTCVDKGSDDENMPFVCPDEPMRSPLLRRMYDGHENGFITALEDDFPPLSQADVDDSRFPHLVKVLRWISEGAPLSADSQ